MNGNRFLERLRGTALGCAASNRRHIETAVQFAVGLVILTHTVRVQAAAFQFQTIALSGQSATGTTDGALFESFSIPVLNNVGTVGFRADVIGADVTADDNSGIWLATSESLNLIARKGGSAPGTEVGTTFDSLGNPKLSDNNELFWYSTLKRTDPSTSSGLSSVWAGTTDGLSLIARNGDTPPETPSGATYLNFAGPNVSSEGIVGLRASVRISTPSFTYGIWTGTSSALSLVALGETPAPGTNLEFQTILEPVVNNQGHTAFSATLPTPDGISNFGIWTQTTGDLELLAKRGDAAPQTEPGTQFLIATNPRMNSHGVVAFTALLDGPNVVPENAVGLWKGTVGNLQLVVRDSDAAPGTNDTFSRLYSLVPINEKGDIAFNAELTGPDATDDNDLSVWLSHDDSLTMIAREGSLAPGTEPDAKFASFGGAPSINAHSQLVISAMLVGPGVNVSNDFGLWFSSHDQLELIVREGDEFNVSDDPKVEDLRTISSIGFYSRSNGEDGLPTAFNRHSALALSLGFTDGTSGVFFAQLVPEPGSWTIASSLFLTLCIYARARSCEQYHLT